MAARGSRGTQKARTEAERARLYAARTEWHEGRIRRRVRDNAIAGVVGGLVVFAAIASQVVHAQVTAPEPTPSPTVTPTDAPVPTESPLPGETPTPSPSASETPAG